MDIVSETTSTGETVCELFDGDIGYRVGFASNDWGVVAIVAMVFVCDKTVSSHAASYSGDRVYTSKKAR